MMRAEGKAVEPLAWRPRISREPDPRQPLNQAADEIAGASADILTTSIAGRRIELMLINELDDKFRSWTRQITDTSNKRADRGRVSFTAMGAGAVVAVTLVALLGYFGYR